MPEPMTNLEPQPRYLSTSEAAEAMGVSVETVRHLCNDGVLEYVRRGRRILISVTSVDNWIRQNRPRQTRRGSSVPGPPLWWVRFRYNPWIFIPTTLLSTLIVLFTCIGAAVSAGADLGPLSRMLKESGVIGACPTVGKDQTLVLVTSFRYVENLVNTEAHRDIVKAIEDAFEEAGSIQAIVRLSPVVIGTGGQDRALKVGKRCNASIIIWGEDRGVETTVAVLDVVGRDEKPQRITISESYATQVGNPTKYVRFIVEDLPNQSTFLAFFILAKLLYLEGEEEAAIVSLEAGMGSLDISAQRILTSQDPLAELMDPVTGLSPEVVNGVGSAWHLYGWIHHSEYNYETAVTCYTLAIQLLDADDREQRREKAETYNHRGVAFADLGHRADAANDFDTAYELYDDFTHKGWVLINKGIASEDTAEAIRIYDDALDLFETDSDRAKALTNLGLTKTAAGMFQDALSDFGAAIDADDELPQALNGRGMLYLFDMNRPDLAIVDFGNAIKIDPEYVEPYTNLASAYSLTGQMDAALDLYERALQISPTDFDTAIILRARSDHFDFMGIRDGALQDLDAAVELRLPDRLKASLLNHRAMVRAGVTYPSSDRLPCQVYGFSSCSPSYLYEIMKDAELLLKDLTDAIQLAPDMAEPYLLRGLIHEGYFWLGLSDGEAALADWSHYLELETDPSKRALTMQRIAELKRRSESTK